MPTRRRADHARSARSRPRFAAAAVALLASAAPARAGVARIAYHGWTGAYRISNGTVDLVFVPQVGRILRFGFVGGPNVLFENPALRGRLTSRASAVKSWPNYGGDKLWPAPQSVWKWPPDPWIDSAPQTVRALGPYAIRVTGQTSPKYGIRFVREIRLSRRGARVTIRNWLQNRSAVPVRWSIWQITQMATGVPSRSTIHNPTSKIVILAPLQPRSHFPVGYHIFPNSELYPGEAQVNGHELRLVPDPRASFKIGTDSRAGRVEARTGGLLFRCWQTTRRGASYPDGGCPQEVYANAAPLAYVELELLGPMHKIGPGGQAELTTHWSLARQRS